MAVLCSLPRTHHNLTPVGASLHPARHVRFVSIHPLPVGGVASDHLDDLIGLHSGLPLARRGTNLFPDRTKEFRALLVFRLTLETLLWIHLPRRIAKGRNQLRPT